MFAFKSDIVDSIARYEHQLIAIRHDLHRHPELGFEEVRTAGIVADTLSRYGIDEVHSGIGKTGVVGVLHGRGGAGPSVGLRADMDAIPVEEENAFAHRSTVRGKMHGCGHDGHTTMLLGAARYLAQHRDFAGTACFFFQPGEEGHAGARAMIEDGLFERFPVRSVYALHNWPSLPPGKVGLNRGPMMAGIDVFDVVIRGRGGHGGHPHEAIDPIVTTAQVISALQSVVSRNVDPLKSAVISLHAINAGTPSALSIIPDAVAFSGIVKWYEKPVQSLVANRLEEVVVKIAAALGATAEVTYRPLYPPTINAAGEAERVMRVAASLLGEECVERNMESSMGSEDFAFMLEARPGAFFRLGTGQRDGEFLHSPRYDFNDAVIPVGAAVLAGIALDVLREAAR
jgi:amidohydrolase